MARNAIVYSIKFPGGTAAEFFEFLRTNGFANDNVLFAGKAASVSIPAFSVKNVRLKDVAKSLDLISEGRLSVEVVEKGEESDENIWRIKPSEGASPLRTKTCPMPSFFRNPGAPKRISGIVDSVEQVVARELEHSGRTRENGHAHMLENEKMVVVVGPAAYVEALSSALEAAEKVAAAEAQAAAAK